MGNQKSQIREKIDCTKLTIKEEEILYIIDESLKLDKTLNQIIQILYAYESIFGRRHLFRKFYPNLNEKNLTQADKFKLIILNNSKICRFHFI
jgi:hypothetical protein